MLPMAVTALCLGVKLSRKREMLIRRTRVLERAIVSLATTIEEATEPDGTAPVYPERDIDVVDGDPR